MELDSFQSGREQAGLFLSVVIPAYNEEHRLGPSIQKLQTVLGAQNWTWEILVVDNGSTDRTLELARELARREPAMRVLHESRRGKGLAVRRGMLEARGQYRFLCDADLSMPPLQVLRFLPPCLNEFDVAIATREAGDSVVVEPLRRRMVGRIFNRLVRALVLKGFRDTQCGFKCFTAPAAETVFRRQRLDGLVFDVEILYIARKHNLRVVEIPITWHYDPDSRVRMFSDSVRMAGDLVRIRRQNRQGMYD